MLDTLMVVFRRWIRREPKSALSPIAEQAKWHWYRKGIAEGRKHHTTVYGPYCDIHEYHLEQSGTAGVYICPLCKIQQQADALERAKHWQPDIERTTGPIVSERPFLAYRREQHEASTDTEQHRALHWQTKQQH